MTGLRIQIQGKGRKKQCFFSLYPWSWGNLITALGQQNSSLLDFGICTNNPSGSWAFNYRLRVSSWAFLVLRILELN
jgi:hypothetical protein